MKTTKQVAIILCSFIVLLMPLSKVFGQVQATMVMKAEKRARQLNKQIGRGRSKSVYKKRFALPSFFKGGGSNNFHRKYRTANKPLKSNYKPNYKKGISGYATPKRTYSTKKTANFKVPFKPAHRTFDNITPFVYEGDRKVSRKKSKDHRAMRLAANFGGNAKKGLSRGKSKRKVRSPAPLVKLGRRKPSPNANAKIQKPKPLNISGQKRVAQFVVPFKSASKFSNPSVRGRERRGFTTNVKVYKPKYNQSGVRGFRGDKKVVRRNPKGVRAEKLKANPTPGLGGGSFLGLNMKKNRTAGALMKYSYKSNSFNKYAFGKKRKSLLAYKPSASVLNKSQGSFKGSMAHARYRRKYKGYDELYEYWGKQITLRMLNVTPSTSFKRKSTSKKGGKNHQPVYERKREHLKYDSREAKVWY